MPTKLIRLALLVVATGLLIAARQQPVEAAICCLDCIDLTSEFQVNCMTSEGIVDSPYCNDLHNQIDFCVNVCNVSSCSESPVCGYILNGVGLQYWCWG